MAGCTPEFLSESVSEEKPRMDSSVAQILSVLWNQKQQYLREPPVISWTTSDLAQSLSVLGTVRMVPEVSQVTSLGQVRSRCRTLQSGRGF